MKQLFRTSGHINGLVTRLTIGLVILPHGLQMLFGWFNGYGFDGTMNYFTQVEGLPWIVGLLVILLQSIGSMLILAGFGGRIMALGMIGLFIGMIVTSHVDHGFFMNWAGNQKGEGFEYHLLVIGLATNLLLSGSGRYSIDHAISKMSPVQTSQQWRQAPQ